MNPLRDNGFDSVSFSSEDICTMNLRYLSSTFHRVKKVCIRFVFSNEK